MHRCRLVLLFSIAFTVCNSQETAFPVIDKADLTGAKFSPSRTFSGTSLFGYIDGGAELYLEYGFSGAVVTEISIGDAKFKTEIFKMNGPEEAFGIFSVSKYRCLSMPDLAVYSCQTKYQLQFSKGPYYISIINSTGTGSDSLDMLKLGKIIAGKITEPDMDPDDFIPGASPGNFRQTGILAKGRLGIVNGSPDLEDFFNGATGFTAVVVKEPGKIIISARFTEYDGFKKFINTHKWDSLKISQNEKRTASDGTTLKLTGENHLLIEIPE